MTQLNYNRTIKPPTQDEFEYINTGQIVLLNEKPFIFCFYRLENRNLYEFVSLETGEPLEIKGACNHLNIYMNNPISYLSYCYEMLVEKSVSIELVKNLNIFWE